MSRAFNKWVICFQCRGDGHVVNPNIDAHGLTAEDFLEDPDFAEDYQSGAYDIACAACKGTGKLLRSQSKAIHNRLSEAASERRMAALEDGDFEAFSVAGDFRYGY